MHGKLTFHSLTKLELAAIVTYLKSLEKVRNSYIFHYRHDESLKSANLTTQRLQELEKRFKKNIIFIYNLQPTTLFDKYYDCLLISGHLILRRLTL